MREGRSPAKEEAGCGEGRCYLGAGPGSRVVDQMQRNLPWVISLEELRAGEVGLRALSTGMKAQSDEWEMEDFSRRLSSQDCGMSS